jgi:hypothetical protein
MVDLDLHNRAARVVPRAEHMLAPAMTASPDAISPNEAGPL